MDGDGARKGVAPRDWLSAPSVEADNFLARMRELTLLDVYPPTAEESAKAWRDWEAFEKAHPVSNLHRCEVES